MCLYSPLSRLLSVIDLLVCSRGIGSEVDEGTRQWSGPSCAVVDLVIFWLTHQPHLTQWLKVMHRVERNTFINLLHFVQIGVTLSNIFEHCVFAIGDRCSELVIERVPDSVILTGRLTRYPPGKFCFPLCSHTRKYFIINSLQLVQGT